MKKIKKLISIFLTVLLVTGLNGCMKNDSIIKMKEDEGENIKDKIIKYMDTKYGKDFVPMSLSRADIDCSYDEFKCYVKGTNKDTEYCTVCRKYSKLAHKYYYTDDYFGRQIEPEYKNELSVIISKFTDKYYLNYSCDSEECPNKYDKSKNLSDILNDSDYTFRPNITIAIVYDKTKQADFTRLSKEICAEAYKNKLHGNYTFYIIDKDTLNTINDNNIDDKLYDNQNIEKIIDIDVD